MRDGGVVGADASGGDDGGSGVVAYIFYLGGCGSRCGRFTIDLFIQV